MEKGSMLVLAIITVLIMSIMVIGMLTIGTTEVKTTQNYQLKKKSFYHAVQGFETACEQIRHAEDPVDVFIAKTISPPLDADGTRKTFYIGSMTGPAAVSRIEDIQAPQLTGISLGTESGFVTAIYRVPVTAEVKAGSKEPAVTEINAGVYALLRTN